MKLLAWILAAAGVLVTAHVLLSGFNHGEFCWECVLPKAPPPPSTRGSNSSLKTLASAQADFRGNDRDGNGRMDYRRGDVAGLYALTPPNGAPIKLCELSMAAADAAPIWDMSPYTVRGPQSGFWYKALRHVDEDPTKLDPTRFAFCAYPASRHHGWRVFIITEDNVVRSRPWNGPGDVPSVCPDYATLRREWTSID